VLRQVFEAAFMHRVSAIEKDTLLLTEVLVAHTDGARLLDSVFDAFVGSLGGGGCGDAAVAGGTVEKVVSASDPTHFAA
jgi:hypothetical protein